MIIETERLDLRPWKESDREPFYQMCSDPEVMEFFPKTLNREESDAFVDKAMAAMDEQGWGLFAVEIRDTEEFIGFIGLNKPQFDAPFTPCVEIGWRLDKKYWKKGFATEGAQALLQFAFIKVDTDEIVSFTSKLNKPSIKVMEKIGMTRDEAGDFDHPMVEVDSPLRRHVLYRYKKGK